MANNSGEDEESSMKILGRDGFIVETMIAQMFRKAIYIILAFEDILVTGRMENHTTTTV